MNRYENIKINKLDNLNRYYVDVFYPEIKKLDIDTYIITNRETRLDTLAYKYYSDPELYWIITICNNLEGSIFVEPGTQLCIPNASRISEIIAEFNILNE